MGTRLIIDGNAVYEIDEDCAECQKRKGGFQSGMRKQGKGESSGDRKGGVKKQVPGT